MKKIYLSVLSLAVVFGASAQKSLPTITTKNDTRIATSKPVVSLPTNQEKATTIWSDDMTIMANWTPDNSANTGGQSANWVYTTDPTAFPDAANGVLNPFLAPSAGTGYWYIDSDGNNFADGSGTRIDANLTLANSVDLSAHPNVILQFTSNYRWWQEDRTVSVSGDNGASWTDFNITVTGTGGFDNGYSPEQNTMNPEVIKINVSTAVGGSSQVLVRFNYDDNDFYGWYWAVDEVSFIDQPLDDVQLLSAYIIGDGNAGAEYGRTPETQLPSGWVVGATIYNFGANDQAATNVVADFGTFTSNSTGLVESDSTRSIESAETLSLLTIGTYTGNYTVSAGTDMMGGAEFGDNTGSRTFEITAGKYSLDGIGVYPSVTGSVLGTNSFDDAATAGVFENSAGLPLVTMYDIKATMAVKSIEVILGSNTTTGGEIVVALIDTSVFRGDAVTPVLIESAAHLITASDTMLGSIVIDLPGIYSLVPGAYYAMATLTVYNAPTEVITIADDETVAQPAWNSAFYLKDAQGANPVQSYTNGVAFGIRLIADGVGLGENSLNGIEVYPNPTTGKFTVTNENGTENTIAIFDMLGKKVYTNTTSSNQTVDLSANGMGVYLVKVSNENGSIVKRVVIK